METNNNLEYNDRESKINFLKQEIINKNYNQLDFINFCISKKNNGDNIDNWTLEELFSLVQDFKKLAKTQDGRFNINILDENEINTEDKEEDNNINIDNEIEEIKFQNFLNGEKDNNNLIVKDIKEIDKKIHKSKSKKGKKKK